MATLYDRVGHEASERRDRPEEGGVQGTTRGRAETCDGARFP